MTAETPVFRPDLAKAPTFTVGRVTISPSTCEVSVGHQRQHLQKRIMQVLMVLASPPQRVVSRDDLIEACWNGRSVSDDAISRCILQLRRLSRELGGFQIHTLVGVGYRLAIEEDAEPAIPPQKYRLSLLGAFNLRAPDGSRISIPGRKSAALIAMLAMGRNGERTRSWLQERLWGERPPAQANASLRQELSRLGRALRGGPHPLVISDRIRVCLDLSHVVVDARCDEEPAAESLFDQEFLEGLSLPEEPSFEAWLRDTRAGLTRSTRPEADPSAAARASLPQIPPDRPSISVMPFVNLSGDPGQDYLAEGMVEEIVGALARFRSIFVVAANSSLILGGKTLSAPEAAGLLGVRYLLEGSVRKVGGCIRVAVILRDAENGAAVWTDRLEDTEGDVFGLQDRVATRVAGVVETTVHDVDLSKAAVRPTANLSSYDLYLRSLPLFRAFTREAILLSIDHLDRAVALDPLFALALSQSAVCHRALLEHGWAKDPDACRTRGLQLVQQALRADGGDAKVLAQCAASVAGFEDDLAGALALIERATAINPNSSFAWLISGTLRLRAGESDLAAEHLETAMRLDPISAMNGFQRMYLALARFQQQRFDEALALLRTTVLRIPVIHAVMAAIHGHAGRAKPAQEALADFRRLEAGNAEDIAAFWFPQAGDRKRFMDGMAAAEGLQETAAMSR